MFEVNRHEHAYQPKDGKKKAEGIKRYRFDCENIHIAVISSQPRMGATTTAIGLSSWLAAVGASVSYVEDNDSGILSAMASDYDMEPDGDGWLLDGVRYGTAPAEETANFIVYDVGCLPSLNETVRTADMLLAVCGTKPYELPRSMLLLRRLETTDAYILCPFTHEKVKGDYAVILQSDFHKVLFLDYPAPSPTDA
jgi:hypothetical protein